MPTSLNLAPVLGFLDELSRNNNKAWFDQHRPAYESARLTFMQLIDSLIDELRESDHLGGLSARDCVARIYRDIRFSRDKSPYKTNMGAIIAPGGWRSQPLGYYISIQPQGQSMVAGGLHSPTPEQLTALPAGHRRAPGRLQTGHPGACFRTGLWGGRRRTAQDCAERL